MSLEDDFLAPGYAPSSEHRIIPNEKEEL